MLDATEENDFENTIEVILKGTEMVVEAEDRSDREGDIPHSNKESPIWS